MREWNYSCADGELRHRVYNQEGALGLGARIETPKGSIPQSCEKAFSKLFRAPHPQPPPLAASPQLSPPHLAPQLGAQQLWASSEMKLLHILSETAAVLQAAP